MRQEDKLNEYPIEELGFYHLTNNGWVRKDATPFPENGVETWSYQMTCPSEDAKEQIWLTRVWKDKHVESADRKALRGRFGIPVEFQTDRHRNLTLQIEV